MRNIIPALDVSLLRSIASPKKERASSSITARRIRRTEELPFRTISQTLDGGLWLGGDKPATEIATGTTTDVVAQLINDPTDEGASWFIAAVGNQINFTPTKMLTPYNTSIVPIGFNHWIHPQPLNPSISFVVSGTGDPSRPSSLATAISLPTADSGLFSYGSNLSANYTESAIATTNPKWSPYLTSTPIGVGTWGVASQFDGSRPDPIGTLAWQSYTHSQLIGGDRTHKFAIFSYDPTKSDPITETLGDATRINSGSATASMSRTANFDSMDYSASSTKVNQTVLSLDLPIIGNQSRIYSSDVLSDTTESITDIRSAGSSGCTANYNRQKIEKFKNYIKSPLSRIVRGRNCALVQERITDSFLFERETTETRTVTSGTVTTVTRPNMRSPSLFSAPFIVSASVTSGPLGGWFAGGSPTEGRAGEPAPQPTIYNKGHKLTTVEKTQFGGIGYGGSDRWFPDSFIGAMFDSPGTYLDNGTNTTVYSEYTVVHTLNPSEIWSLILSYSPTYNWNYNRVVTTQTIQDFVDQKNNFLVTEVATIPLTLTRSEIFARIAAGRISAPPLGQTGTLTFTGDSVFSITIDEAKLTREQITVTETLNYTAATQTQNTTHTTRVYTGEALETVIGKKVEVYTQIGNLITRYVGTLSSYSGVERDTKPAPGGQTSPGNTFTNEFIGPYRSRTSVRSLAIAVTESSIVPFCPWPLEIGSVTLTINPDHAIFNDTVSNAGSLLEPPLNARYCNVVADSDSACSLYVCSPNNYKSGEENYAAVWNISGSSITLNADFVSGDSEVGPENENFKSILYYPV